MTATATMKQRTVRTSVALTQAKAPPEAGGGGTGGPTGGGTPPQRTLSARATVSEWVGLKMEGADEVSVPRMSEEAVSHFQDDATFMRRLVAEMVPVMVREIARERVASTRRGGRRRLYEIGDDVVTEEALNKRANQLAAKWTGWMEFVGDRHVRLMTMDGPTLLQAAQERDGNVRKNAVLRDLLVGLAKDLPEGATVEDFFTVEEIEGRQQALEAAYQSGIPAPVNEAE
jgi:hypothetical protein